MSPFAARLLNQAVTLRKIPEATLCQMNVQCDWSPVLILSLSSNEAVHVGLSLSAEVSSKDYYPPPPTVGEELGGRGGGGNIRKPAAGSSLQVFYPSAPSFLPALRPELGIGEGRLGGITRLQKKRQERLGFVERPSLALAPAHPP